MSKPRPAAMPEWIPGRLDRGDFTPQRILCGCHGIECVWLWDVRHGRKKWMLCYVQKIDGTPAWNGRDKFYVSGTHYPHSFISWLRWRNGQAEAKEAVDYLAELAKNAASIEKT